MIVKKMRIFANVLNMIKKFSSSSKCNHMHVPNKTTIKTLEHQNGVKNCKVLII
jgi:hypothetical protein